MTERRSGLIHAFTEAASLPMRTVFNESIYALSTLRTYRNILEEKDKRMGINLLDGKHKGARVEMNKWHLHINNTASLHDLL